MTKVKNSLQKIFKLPSYQERVQKAQERFAFKPFIVQYETLRRLCDLRVLLHFLSILLAFMLVYVFVDATFHNKALSAFTAFFFLSLWEGLKSSFLKVALEGYYSTLSVAWFPSICGLFTLLGSVYLSLEGATVYHEQYDTTIQDFKEHYRTQVDSVNRLYDARVQAQKEELADYKESVEWLGKIDMSIRANKEMVTSFGEKIRSLEGERSNELSRLEGVHDRSRSEVDRSASYNRTALVVAASINEFLILFLMWFVVYYDYMAKKQATAIARLGKKTFVSLEDIQSLFALSGFPANAVADVRQISPNANAIGFRTGTNSHAHTNYIDKYSAVVQSIRDGLNETEILRLHDVGRTTLYNIKRAMRQSS